MEAEKGNFCTQTFLAHNLWGLPPAFCGCGNKLHALLAWLPFYDLPQSKLSVVDDIVLAVSRWMHNSIVIRIIVTITLARV